ncbi:hypothetical protein C8J57DRAFT_1717189 [Mycena rebaudengoi]|nr:hypothetical protein C8J57DRAFT_1717189 [Mycena rebaudengoi]
MDAATLQPTFPEDLERVITEVLLSDARDMCSTMSLLASRFYSWTTPFRFHTVVVHRRKNWMRRIRDCVLPRARFIRILVLNLPFREGRRRGQCPDEALALIRCLLDASRSISHLAVTWNIWSDLQIECGALRLESLYLIWDGAFYTSSPSLHCLQHPATLADLTVGAPSDLDKPMLPVWHPKRYLPALAPCVNLAYLTYVSDRTPFPSVAYEPFRGTMLVLVCTSPYDEQRIKRDTQRYPQYLAICVRHWNEVLIGWVAKVEGRESLLNHVVATRAVDND